MKDYTVEIVSNKPSARGIYEMTLACTNEKFEKMRCGQFLHLSIPNSKFLLRRPFCLYKFGDTEVTIAYAVVGEGTKEMTELKAGTLLKAALPLGNGFWLDEKYRKVALVGGGMGCAPLAYVPVTYPDRKYFSFLGFSDKSRMTFTDEFSSRGETAICTDDGSFGFHGYPTQILENKLDEIKPDVILACGPRPMLKGVQKFAAEHKIDAFASMEERMGCGVGACLVCTCKIKEKNGNTAMRRVCADGPIFRLEDIEL